MADPRLFRLRVVFAKRGRLAMLSHLELCRALERAVRRAKLPYAVSQGFSPHMRIAFGAALPVGVGGTHEFFDLFLESYVAPQKALCALRGASADDLMVESCAYVDHAALAASVAFPVCTYRAVLSDAVDELVVPETVTVMRKKKEKTLAVGEFLRDLRFFDASDADCGEGACVQGGCAGNGGEEGFSQTNAEGVFELDVRGGAGSAFALPRKTIVEFTLEAKPTGSLRPDVFLSACIDATIAADRASEGLCVLSVMRIAQRSLDGEELS